MYPTLLFALSMVPPIGIWAALATPIAPTQTFARTTTWTFSSGTSLPTNLIRANYSVLNGYAPYVGRRYAPENVYMSDGYLNLRVNGGQNETATKGYAINSSAIFTKFTVAAASVETFGILTETPGVVNGMFFYANDTQECDIEWLSDPTAQSNINSKLGRAIFYTNQAVKKGTTKTLQTSRPPYRGTETVHSYRIDWNGVNSTTFYLDNELLYSFNTNVPTAKNGKWVWNNWSNGKNYFGAGPPLMDAIFKISKIVMKYDPGI